MDNCWPNGTDLLYPTEQATVITLPPNCTSMFPPMEMGIIACLKVRYRSIVLSRTLEVFQDRSQLLNAAKDLAAGLKGLEEGRDPHMLDVAEMLENVWGSIEETTIARCWIKSDILPKSVNADLLKKHGKLSMKKNSDPENDLKNLIDLFKNLRLQRQNGELRENVIDRNILDATVVRLALPEDDDQIREAMARYFIEELEERNFSDGTDIEQNEVENVDKKKDFLLFLRRW